MRTCVDLFTGLGGFTLAAHANGVQTVAFVERDEKCRTFLNRAWPGVDTYDDIRTFANGPVFRYRGVWLLTGGPPCQPASRAGQQGGAGDDRWLWGETVQCLAAIRPAWALFENPVGVGDLVEFRGVLADMAALGYEVRIFNIPACAVGAPHRRERLWIVCHLDDADGERPDPEPVRLRKRGSQPGDTEAAGSGGSGMADANEAGRRTQPTGQPGDIGPQCPPLERGAVCSVADAAGLRWESGRAAEPGEAQGGRAWADDRRLPGNPWRHAAYVPCADGKFRRAPACPVCLAARVSGGVPETLAGCQNQIKAHRSLLGALGNAVVPQIPLRLMAAMIQAENEDSSQE